MLALTYKDASLASYANSSTPVVVCPICRKGNLLENKGVIFCNCGLRLNVQSNITLDFVNQLLCEAYNAHSATCAQDPAFVLRNQFGISTLCLYCEHCDALHVVI